MRQFFKRTIAAPLLLLAFTTVMADPIETAVITKAVNRLMPKAKPDSITQSSIPGLYEVIVGTQVLYVSKDGKYVLEGDLYDIDQQKNLTEAFKRSCRSDKQSKRRYNDNFRPEKGEAYNHCVY